MADAGKEKIKLDDKQSPQVMALSSHERHIDQVLVGLQAQLNSLKMRNEELQHRLLGPFAGGNLPVVKQDQASQCTLQSHGSSITMESPHPLRLNTHHMLEMLDEFERNNHCFLDRVKDLVTIRNKMTHPAERPVPWNKRPTSGTRRGSASRATTLTKRPCATAVKVTSGLSPRHPEQGDPSIMAVIESVLADREKLCAEGERLTQSLRNGLLHLGSADRLDAPTTASSVGAVAAVGGTLPAVGCCHCCTNENQNSHLQAANKVAFSGDLASRSEPNAEVNVSNQKELQVVKKERDELQTALNDFEHNLLEIQEKVRNLQSEKRDLLAQLNEVRKLPITLETFDQMARSSSEPFREFQSHQPQGRNCVRSRSNRVYASTSEALEEFLPAGVQSTSKGTQTTSHEADSLELCRLKQAYADAEEQLQSSRRSLEELKQQQQVERLTTTAEAQCTRHWASGEEEEEKSRRALEQLRTTLLQVRSQNAALASELSMRNDMYSELARGKQLSDSRISEAQRDLHCLNSRLTEADLQLKHTREEVERLQKVASQLDAEKDTLQSTLDDHTEHLVALKQELTHKTQLLEKNKGYLSSVELRLRRVTETAAERDREVRTLNERLQELETSSSITHQSRVLVEEKLIKAKSDAGVLNHEVVNLSTRLQEANNENIGMKYNLNEASQKVASIEQALEGKTREYNELLLQYGTLSKEFEATCKRNTQLEHLQSSMEEEMREKDVRLKSHLDRLQSSELDTITFRLEGSALEKKCAMLTATVEKTECRASQLEGELDQLRRQLSASRGLAGDLQARLEQATVQATDRDMAARNLAVRLADCERQLEKALQETVRQRETVQHLESFLSAARQNEQRLQIALKERTEECSGLQKEAKTARQAVNVATSEALALHRQLTTQLQRNASSTSTLTSSTAAVPPVSVEVAASTAATTTTTPCPTTARPATAALTTTQGRSRHHYRPTVPFSEQAQTAQSVLAPSGVQGSNQKPPEAASTGSTEHHHHLVRADSAACSDSLATMSTSPRDSSCEQHTNGPSISSTCGLPLSHDCHEPFKFYVPQNISESPSVMSNSSSSSTLRFNFPSRTPLG